MIHHGEPEIVRIEISPSENWTTRNRLQVQAMQFFNLPQDFEAYLTHYWAEIAYRA